MTEHGYQEKGCEEDHQEEGCEEVTRFQDNSGRSWKGPVATPALFFFASASRPPARRTSTLNAYDNAVKRLIWRTSILAGVVTLAIPALCPAPRG